MNSTFKRNIREIILYVLFGALTTIVSLVSYWLFTRWFGLVYYWANVLSWILAVAFAFITSKTIVFRDTGELPKKIILFLISRMITLGIDTAILFLGIEMLKIDDFLTKVFVQVVVVAANYLLGKFLVFRKVDRKL